MKTFCKLMVVGALALAATPAAATTFVGSYGVTANTDTENGLAINWAPLNPVNLTLTTLNQSTSFSLFDLYTNESSIQDDDKAPKQIAVNFTFTQPGNAGGSVTGTTDGDTFGLFGYYQYGEVHWANGGNATFNFDGGSQLKVHLSDAVFNFGDFWNLHEGAVGGAPIEATFTMSKLGAAVPEPGTWAMMIMGFGMVGVGLRMRRREEATLA